MGVRSIRIFAVLVLLMAALTSNAFADWRRYAWTYEYMTMAKGAKEIEYSS